jgi:hypothetical protein
LFGLWAVLTELGGGDLGRCDAADFADLLIFDEMGFCGLMDHRLHIKDAWPS